MTTPTTNPTSTTVIRDITPGLTLLSVPFQRGPIKLGGAATVIKLSSGSLAIVSPISLTDDVRAKLSSLGGEVKYLVAPNIDHNIHLAAWSSAFPSAQVIAPEGLRGASNPEVHLTYTAENKTTLSISPEFDADFEIEYIAASKLHELVLLHRPTRTLIQGDLVFNLPATEAFSKSGMDASSGIATRLLGAVLQTANPAWQKRALWYGSATDRVKFGESVRRIAGWDFDRIVPCHGDVVETGGKGVFEGVAELFLKA